MKKEINRTLGNSLRCILPSFWWKRLLGKMVDKIESAESSASSAMKMAILAGDEASAKQDRLVSGSNIKTINHQSILGSGNIIVDTDKVEKYKTKDDLDANGSLAGGDIAAVVDALLIEKSFTECYQPTRSEIETTPYNKKFTKVDSISLNPDFNPNLISSNYGSLSIKLYSDGKSKGYHKEYPSYLEIECDYNRRIICWEYEGTSGSGHTLYGSSGFNASKIDRVNNILREGDFRFSYFKVTYRVNVSDDGYTSYYSYNENFPSDATAMIDSFVKMIFAETQNADIYVRSAEWVKLLKEGDVTGDGADKTLTFYAPIDDVSLSDAEKQHNAESYQKVAEGFESDKYYDIKVLLSTFQLVALDVIKTINPANDNGRLKLIFGGGGFGLDLQRLIVTSDGSATITIEGIEESHFDSELSTTSINAVQNKVITAALNDKVDKTYVDEKVANVAGTNLKTINGVSLRGEGNIELHMSEIHKKLQDLRVAVLNNEEVLAAALNDINRRLLELENLSN